MSMIRCHFCERDVDTDFECPHSIEGKEVCDGCVPDGDDGEPVTTLAEIYAAIDKENGR